MSADVDQLALVEDQNLVGIHNGRQALRDDEDDGVLDIRLEGPSKVRIRRIIQGRKAIVKEIDARASNQCAGNGQALSLAPAEIQCDGCRRHIHSRNPRLEQF